MENETGAGRAQYFSIFGKVFLKMFEFSSQKILQDCVLVAKAIYDGVVFLARSCGGATRSSAPSASPAVSNCCTDRYGADTIPLSR